MEDVGYFLSFDRFRWTFPLMEQDKQQPEHQSQAGKHQAKGQRVDKTHRAPGIIGVEGKVVVIRRLLHAGMGGVLRPSKGDDRLVPQGQHPLVGPVKQTGNAAENEARQNAIHQGSQHDGYLGGKAQGWPIEAKTPGSSRWGWD